MTDEQLLAAAKASHRVWVEHKRKMKCHGPDEPCTLRANLQIQHAAQMCEDGKVRCHDFFPCMTDWDKVDPRFQEYNLNIARAVIEAYER